MKKPAFIVLFLIITVSLSAQEIAIPVLERRVTDLTNTLDIGQKSIIEQQLQEHEDSTGNQIVILIIPTTGLESIEEYSMRVAEAWEIGREGIDDGVILLVAKNDRKLRIEVGYGLESVITDADASIIIDEYIVPEFKDGDFYLGIYSGINEIINLINGGDLVSFYDYADSYDYDAAGLSFLNNHTGLCVLMIVFSMIFPGLLFAFTKKKVWAISLILLVIIIFQLLTGLAIGVVWLSIIFILPTLIIGLLIIAFRKKTNGKVSFWGGGGSYSSSVYSSSSYSSSSFGSGSSYSGGGGSFGGGGASGSW